MCPHRFRRAFSSGEGILHREGSDYLLPCEVNCTRNTDDEKANNDGGDGHPLGIPPEPLGSFDVSIIVAVQRLGDTKEELVMTDNRQGKTCASQADLSRQHGYHLLQEAFPGLLG